MKNYLVATLALALLASAPACHRPCRDERDCPAPSKEIDVEGLKSLLNDEEMALEEDESDLLADDEQDLLVFNDTEDLFGDQEEDHKEL